MDTLTVGTTPLYWCHGNYHLWDIMPQSTDTEVHPRPGDLCICGAARWPHTTRHPPLRDSRTDTSI